MNDLEKNPLKIMIAITDRGKGKKVVEINNRFGVFFQSITLGKGTADKQMLQILGIGESQKDVVICVVKSETTHAILDSLENELAFNQPGQGIAFTISIQSVSSLKALNILLGNKMEV